MVWSQYLVIWYGDLPEENGQSSTVDLAGTREAPYRRVVSVTTFEVPRVLADQPDRHVLSGARKPETGTSKTVAPRNQI